MRRDDRDDEQGAVERDARLRQGGDRPRHGARRRPRRADARHGPAEVRRRNFIGKDEFPYRTNSGLNIDTGDYHSRSTRRSSSSDYEALRAEQRRLREAGPPPRLRPRLRAHAGGGRHPGHPRRRLRHDDGEDGPVGHGRRADRRHEPGRRQRHRHRADRRRRARRLARTTSPSSRATRRSARTGSATTPGAAWSSAATRRSSPRARSARSSRSSPRTMLEADPTTLTFSDGTISAARRRVDLARRGLLHDLHARVRDRAQRRAAARVDARLQAREHHPLSRREGPDPAVPDVLERRPRRRRRGRRGDRQGRAHAASACVHDCGMMINPRLRRGPDARRGRDGRRRRADGAAGLRRRRRLQPTASRPT